MSDQHCDQNINQISQSGNHVTDYIIQFQQLLGDNQGAIAFAKNPRNHL